SNNLGALDQRFGHCPKLAHGHADAAIRGFGLVLNGLDADGRGYSRPEATCSIVFAANRSSACTDSSRCSSFVSSSLVCESPRSDWTNSIIVGTPARDTSAASCRGPLGSRCELLATSRTASSASSINCSSKGIGSIFQIR